MAKKKAKKPKHINVYEDVISTVYPKIERYYESPEHNYISFYVDDSAVSYATLEALSKLVNSTNINFTGLNREGCSTCGYGSGGANIEIGDVAFPKPPATN